MQVPNLNSTNKRKRKKLNEDEVQPALHTTGKKSNRPSILGSQNRTPSKRSSNSSDLSIRFSEGVHEVSGISTPGLQQITPMAGRRESLPRSKKGTNAKYLDEEVDTPLTTLTTGGKRKRRDGNSLSDTPLTGFELHLDEMDVRTGLTPFHADGLLFSDFSLNNQGQLPEPQRLMLSGAKPPRKSNGGAKSSNASSLARKSHSNISEKETPQAQLNTHSSPQTHYSLSILADSCIASAEKDSYLMALLSSTKKPRMGSLLEESDGERIGIAESNDDNDVTENDRLAYPAPPVANRGESTYSDLENDPDFMETSSILALLHSTPRFPPTMSYTEKERAKNENKAGNSPVSKGNPLQEELEERNNANTTSEEENGEAEESKESLKVAGAKTPSMAKNRTSVSDFMSQSLTPLFNDLTKDLQEAHGDLKNLLSHTDLSQMDEEDSTDTEIVALNRSHLGHSQLLPSSSPETTNSAISNQSDLKEEKTLNQLKSPSRMR